MQCLICGEEVDNSEALAQHMEKMHALDETDEPEKEESPETTKDAELPGPAPIVPGRM